MVVAAQHAKGKGARAGQDVEEGLFFDGVALESRHVASRYEKSSILVEADLAYSPVALQNDAPMAAGVAQHPVPGQLFIEFTLLGIGVDEPGQRAELLPGLDHAILRYQFTPERGRGEPGGSGKIALTWLDCYDNVD